jgi:DNA-binding NtrC family response regulator
LPPAPTGEELPADEPPLNGAPMPADATPMVSNEHGVLRLDAIEKHAILAALRQTDGNRTQAAAALGISIRTLRNKLQEYRDAGDTVVDVDGESDKNEG